MYERDKGFSFFLGHSMDQYRITVVTGENIVATVFSTHDHLWAAVKRLEKNQEQFCSKTTLTTPLWIFPHSNTNEIWRHALGKNQQQQLLRHNAHPSKQSSKQAQAATERESVEDCGNPRHRGSRPLHLLQDDRDGIPAEPGMGFYISLEQNFRLHSLSFVVHSTKFPAISNHNSERSFLPLLRPSWMCTWDSSNCTW